MLLGGNNGYYEKQPGVFVEKNKYRINSPGEIQNISMKGVRASRNTPKNTKPKTKTVKIKDKKINNKIKKFMKGGFI